MSPILGIIASSKALAAGDFESIASTSLTGTQSSITFTESGGAWSNYKHLQIRLFARVDGSVTQNGTKVQFNSDTGANYTYHTLYGNGSSPTAYGEANTNQNFMDKASGANAGASMFGAMVCDILDFRETSKYKTTRSFGGTDQNGSGAIFLSSGVWRNTAAITSITLSPFDGYSYVQYTHAALYGIKD